MKILEAQHLFGNPLDETMVLFNNIVEIFDLQDFYQLACASDFQDRVYSLRTGQVGSAFINDYLVRNPIACNGLFKETPCSAEISVFREHEVKSVTVTINGPIEISPFAFDLYVGSLIDR